MYRSKAEQGSYFSHNTTLELKSMHHAYRRSIQRCRKKLIEVKANRSLDFVHSLERHIASQQNHLEELTRELSGRGRYNLLN